MKFFFFLKKINGLFILLFPEKHLLHPMSQRFYENTNNCLSIVPTGCEQASSQRQG